MDIPDSLLFEMIGRRELALEIQRRQGAELTERLQNAEAYAKICRERAESASSAVEDEG